MAQIATKLLADSYSLTGPGIQPSGNSVSVLEKIISSIIGIMTVAGVIFFTIHIILAGFSLISSQGDPKMLDTGKKRLTTSVLGLAIVILAYGLGALVAKLLGMSSIFDLSTVFKPIK
jgi:uncharacterized membrane protein